MYKIKLYNKISKKGIQVANLALRFGMNVYGYDPYISIDAAWNLSRYVNHVKSIDEICRKCDFITLHLPLNEQTKNFIHKDIIKKMKDGVKILNFARGGLINENDLLLALDTRNVAMYITDFPTSLLVTHPNVISIPHLGASTVESEDNCAILAAQQLKDYLEHGNIKNSVNLPNVVLDFNNPFACLVFIKTFQK